MQISGPILWSTTSILGAYTVGTLAFVGRRVGEADRAGAAAGLRASLGLALVLGAGAAVGGVALIDALHQVLFSGAGPAVHASSRAYLEVALPAVVPYLVSFTASLALQAAGDTRRPFLVAALGNVLNVPLTLALVFGLGPAPELGSRGAALATSASLVLQSVVLLGLLARREGRLTWRGRGGERDALRRMLRVASASVGERVLQHAGYLSYVAMIGTLGATAMAANQALLSSESVVFLSADGFGIATAAVVAQRLGAGRRHAASVALRAGAGLAAASLGAVGVAFVLGPDLLLGLFTSSREVRDVAGPCLVVAAVAAPVLGAAVVHADALRGAGATRAALAVTFFGGVVVRVGATALLVFGLALGLLGAWLASTADWALRLLCFARIAAGTRWRKRRV